jgi:hypothetical protein
MGDRSRRADAAALSAVATFSCLGETEEEHLLLEG